MKEFEPNLESQMDLPGIFESTGEEVEIEDIQPEPILPDKKPGVAEVERDCPWCDTGGDCGRDDCPQSVAKREKLAKDKNAFKRPGKGKKRAA